VAAVVKHESVRTVRSQIPPVRVDNTQKNARAIEVSTVRVADRRKESILRDLRAVSPRVFLPACIDQDSALLLPILPGTQILRFNGRGRVRTHD